MASVAYVNGHVYTVNDQQPWAEAFIVDEDSGTFTAIGSTEDIQSISKANGIITYDLHGTFIMPGIHDAHTHLLAASMQKLNEVAISPGSNEHTLAMNLKMGECHCSYAHVFGDWLVANFYDAEHFPNGQPDRKFLDEAFPNRPVLIRETTCHSILLNTEGLRVAGYDIENPIDPHAGVFVRRSSGEITGELVEAATEKAWMNIPLPSLQHAKRAISYAVNISHRYGITSCQEASANSVYMHAIRELDAEKALNMAIFPHIVYAPAYKSGDTEANLQLVLQTAEDFRSEHVDPRFVKFWLDGAPLPPHFSQANLSEAGQPEQEKILIERERLVGILEELDTRGLTCKLHCAGEGSARYALDAIEGLRRRNPNGPRHELAHNNAVHEDDIPRFASLRVTAEMSPAIFHHQNLTNDYPKLFKWPFKQVLETGGLVTIGSDWILPPSPNLFPALGALVSELGAETIIKLITLAGATAVGYADRLGSIEVGKKASFIAIDRDLTRGDFSSVTVLKTWFEGKMVWNSREDGLHRI
ncbi:amidohydrolase-like protein 3 [Aspergillus granulosus]|uniref:Amidohydrolase-like protein 3 n=1 Tax=Aspergillus granulosus TaxID=176169 RepID=A0ABR4GS26_9EURO